METSTPIERPYDETVWTDNGFTNAELMNTCHQVILEAPMPHDGTIVDFGCGDGRLLYRLNTRYPDRRVVGIESQHEKIRRGRERHPGVEFHAGDMFQVKWEPCGTAILNPKRLIELYERDQRYRAAGFLRDLKDHSGGCVIYTYEPQVLKIEDMFRDSHLFEEWGIWWTYKFKEVEVAVLYRSNENPAS